MTGRVPRLMAAALAVARRGWPVFPVAPGGKRPAITGWPHRATRDPDQLAAWWERAPYNIGLACGEAGLLVVDLDQPQIDQAPPARWAAGDVRDGRAVLAALACEAGHPDPSDTYIVATPRGEHRYFTVPTADLPAARCTTGTLGWLIDTRAAGGYVLAAGSVRHVDGQRRYYHRTSPAGIEPAPAPRWLLEALAPPGPAARGAEPPRHPDAYIRAVLQAETDQIRRAAVGTRNTTVFHAARRLGQISAAGLLDDEQITSALRAAAVHHVGIDGFTDAEAAGAISNGLRYGHRHPRTAGWRLPLPRRAELAL